MANSLLNSAAVARRSGQESGTILKAYIDTNPSMALNHTTPEPSAEKAPKGAGGAVDPTRG